MKKEKTIEFDQRRADYKTTFLNSASGQAVLADLEKSFCSHTSFHAANPHITSFNEGQRAVVLAIKLLIEAPVDMQITYNDEEND